MEFHLTLLQKDNRLFGCSLDECSPCRATDGREVAVAGWVIGGTRRAVAVEVCVDGEAIQRLATIRHRPDVADAYRSLPGAATSGFNGKIVCVSVPRSGFEFRAVLDDQQRVPFARMTQTSVDDQDLERLPKVSVVIPCYRQSHFLGEAIGSVLAQDYPKIEVTVVDDGSPDNTEEIARRIPGVIYVRQTNQGLSAARNSGLRASSGDFLTFLDADDRLTQGAVSSALAQFSRNPEFGFVAGQFQVISFDGRVLHHPRVAIGDSQQYLQMIADYFIGPPGAIVFRRRALEAVGAFDSSVNEAADYDLTLRVARKFTVCVQEHLALEYRKHGSNMTTKPAAMLRTTMRVLKRQWAFVRTTVEGRRAYQSGLQHWQKSWGEPLVQKIVADLRAGGMPQVNDVGTLIRYYPKGLVAVVTRALQDENSGTT